MDRLLYYPQDIACLIYNHDMKESMSQRFVSLIWEEEKSFIQKKYRHNKRQFILDVMSEKNYLTYYDDYNSEFPQVNRDLKDIGSETVVQGDDYYNDFELYFKNVRLRILFIESQDFVRAKLRSLLSEYGYKHRTRSLLDYFHNCLYFYHIETYVRGKVKCDINDIQLDDMITFRITE